MASFVALSIREAEMAFDVRALDLSEHRVG